MSRMPRRHSESDIYHVFLRGSGRQLIFEDDKDRNMFLHILRSATEETNSTLYAYCLMGNHYHLIVKSDFEALPKFAHKLNRTYATYFNEQHDRSGHLFESRYKSQPIETDSYFLDAIRYVHRNPIEARISTTCDYPWSSYADYLSTEKNNQVVSCNVVRASEMIGGPESFKEFHSHSCKRRLADDRPTNATMTEESMVDFARVALGGMEPNNLKGLPKAARDRKLRRLKLSGLTQTQISLITGISLSTVNRA